MYVSFLIIQTYDRKWLKELIFSFICILRQFLSTEEVLYLSFYPIYVPSFYSINMLNTTRGYFFLHTCNIYMHYMFTRIT
jgi:hypothetical protein